MKKLLSLLCFMAPFLYALHAEAQCPGGVCGPTNRLQWNVPTTNTDGSPLTDFAGFRVFMSPASGACASPGAIVRDVGNLGVPATPNPGPVSVLLSVVNPTVGLVFACVKAYDTTNIVSAGSNEVSFTYAIPNLPPAAPSGLTTQ